MKAINIKWNVHNEETCLLPKEIEIPDGIYNDEEIQNYIAKKTGHDLYFFKLKGNLTPDMENLLTKISDLCHEAVTTIYNLPEIQYQGILNYCDGLSDRIDEILHRNAYAQEIEDIELE